MNIYHFNNVLCVTHDSPLPFEAFETDALKGGVKIFEVLGQAIRVVSPALGASHGVCSPVRLGLETEKDILQSAVIHFVRRQQLLLLDLIRPRAQLGNDGLLLAPRVVRSVLRVGQRFLVDLSAGRKQQAPPLLVVLFRLLKKCQANQHRRQSNDRKKTN